MPYMLRSEDGKVKVYKKGADGKPTGEALGTHPNRAKAKAQLAALYANEPGLKELGYKVPKGNPTSFDDYAVGDPDEESTWKLQIQDREHVGLAIAALSGDANAPHGQGAKLSPEERRQAVSRIRKRIGSVAHDDADKKAMLAKLNAHGSKGMYDYPIAASYDYDGFVQKLDPDDPRVMFDPVGGDSTNACANCYFYDADDVACRLVYGDIPATGLSNLWLRQLTTEEKLQQRAMPMIDVSGKESVPLMEQFKNMLEGLFKGNKAAKTDSEVDFSSGFKAFGPDNQYWAAFWSNNAQDRDGEWFAEKAHDAYIADLDSGEWPMPLLDFWHTKAFHGQAFWVDRVGHVMLAVGKFDDSPLADGMKEYYATHGDKLRVSHGFLFDPAQRLSGVYHDYHSFEISPLPADIAANEHTGFMNIEEFQKQMLTDEKRKQLAIALENPALAEKLLAAAGKKSAELDRVATSFKDSGSPVEMRLKSLEDKFELTLEALATLARKAKKGEEGSPEEEDTESEAEAEEEGDKPKKKAEKAHASTRHADGYEAGYDDGHDDASSGVKKPKKEGEKARDPYAALNDLATAFKSSMAQQQKTNELLANGLNAIYKEIANPVSAQRSPYTIVPPSDPALEALKARMEGNGDQNVAPNAMPETVSLEEYGATVFGPGLFGGNGHNGGS